MLCDVVRRRRRRWAHAPVIHAASHFDHNKRVAWVPISMHTCGSFFYNYGAPLGGPSGRRSSAITEMAIRQRFTLLLVCIKKIRTPPVIHCPITERFLLLIQTELIFILILNPQITVKNSNKLKLDIRYRLFEFLI